MDRIDIQKEVKPVNFFNLENQKESLSSAWIREKVEKARMIQQERYKNEKVLIVMPRCRHHSFSNFVC